MEMRNAVIRSAVIEIEDHNFLTAWLHVEYSGGGQGFGGWVLDGPYLATFVRRCMEIADVRQWDHLVGKPIRIWGDSGKIHGIAHFTKDGWFNVEAEFDKVRSTWVQAEKSEQVPSRPDFVEEAHLDYLDNLRDSSIVNMFGAVPYLLEEFSGMTQKEARQVLQYWMESFGNDLR